jgi:hypothetical protein
VRDRRLFDETVALAAAVALMLGCQGKAAPIAGATTYAAPGIADRGLLCTDVGVTRRVCWGDSLTGPGCSNGACVVERPVPAVAPDPDGWRCGGMAKGRVCEPRRRNSGAFRCESGQCVQSRPRMPDDGEWECVEMDGVVFCHFRAAAAGMVDGPVDVGWLCGERRGHKGGERICVDLAPDRPGPEADWRCAFEYTGGSVTRRCARSDRVQVDSACSGAVSCPRGSECVSDHCVPARPMPACWLDADCGQDAHCRWGTCAPGPP